MRLLALLILLSSCGAIQERPYTVEYVKKPVSFEYYYYRSGEYFGDPENCWKGVPEEMFSYFQYEKNGDLTREMGNITMGYARAGGDEPDPELSPKRFDAFEVDWPYDMTMITLDKEYCLLIQPAKYGASFPVFYLFSKRKYKE